LTQGFREAGFAVDATGDGEEGYWYAETGDYDVIVLDLMLPGCDGLTVLQRLRRKGVSSRVLVLTAKDTVPDRILGLNEGADDYLVKPFAFGELLARVNALVRRRYDTAGAVLRIADLTIDTRERSVRRGERALDLTGREYLLLEYLAHRQGQIVTRNEIWEHLYDFNAEQNSNVIDVHIGHLRKKLEQHGGARLIHTRRGLGYRLAAEA
jgi:DNA-binding response OmpR family regulator